MEKRPVGRPRANIDPKMVLELAQIGCKNQEIADFFGVNPQTIEQNFLPELVKGRADVRMSLRRWQLRAAEEGNATMLVWLGKQMLGQTDVIDLSITAVRELKELPDIELDALEKKLLDGPSES